MDENRPRCAHCERDSHEVPLLTLRYHEHTAWICSQHLPILIHNPRQLAGKLADAERLAPADGRDRDAEWPPFLDAALSVLRLIHIVTAVMMAWPFYALVTVNNRTRLGPPLGDRVDVYMEHIVKSRTIPCDVFQATALVTGLAIILLRGLGLGTLVTNAALGLKVAFLLLIAGLLSHVHLRLQPAIDRLFA